MQKTNLLAGLLMGLAMVPQAQAQTGPNNIVQACVSNSDAGPSRIVPVARPISRPASKLVFCMSCSFVITAAM